jgi:hypothetical protein
MEQVIVKPKQTFCRKKTGPIRFWLHRFKMSLLVYASDERKEDRLLLVKKEDLTAFELKNLLNENILLTYGGRTRTIFIRQKVV